MADHRVAIFASGTGSNAAVITEYFKDHPSIHIALIVSGNPAAGVLAFAESRNIPTLLLEKRRFSHGDGYVEELHAAGIDFIVLAGFLWKIPPTLIQAYPGRIVNIHPALLPKYGGKGMYGMHVHESVLAHKEKESGITIHYVDELYDHGSIIFQEKCAVDPEDTASSLQHKVQILEHRHFAPVVEQLLNGLS
jgi:phosphoribosylglycinamide formyltransferase-1